MAPLVAVGKFGGPIGMVASTLLPVVVRRVAVKRKESIAAGGPKFPILHGIGDSLRSVGRAIFGPAKTATARPSVIAKVIAQKPLAPIVPAQIWHDVRASSFADPADVAAFRRAKAAGKSDQEAFKVGDNAIGCWGDPTDADRPMCALPRDDWKHLGGIAQGAGVLVQHLKTLKVVRCELRDTMPAKKNIKNGCGIDLNPAACKAFGVKPPCLEPVSWAWENPKFEAGAEGTV